MSLLNKPYYTNTKKAIEILQKYKNWNGKYVLFSGGKDSLVCLDLAYRCWKDSFKVVYIEVTGNTHPKCNKYVHKTVNEYGLELIHLIYDRDFFDMLKELGYPSVLWAGPRWCLQRFKDIPMIQFNKNNTVNLTVAGVKQGDSNRRRTWISKNVIDGRVINPRKKVYGKVQLYPIYNWEREDVWNYIKQNNLPLNPLYEEIGRAGNCVICPALKECEFLAIMQKCPEFFYKWKKAHEKLRRDFTNGKLRGVKVTFYKFDRWYKLYCLNKKLASR